MQKAVSGMRSGFEPLFAAFAPIFPSALLNFLSDFKGALFLYDEFSDCFQLVFREILALIGRPWLPRTISALFYFWR